MKKIAFFTPSLNIGGIERVFMTYANALTSDYKIDYVVCYAKGDLNNFLDNAVNCVTLHTRLPYSLFKISRYLKINKPDFVITGGDIPNAIVIIANIIAGSKSKVVISQHNYLNIEQNIFLSKFIYRFIYRYAYKIIAVSNDIAKFLTTFQIEKGKVITIYNPIDLRSIHCLSEEVPKQFNYSNYILYVGRFSTVKNLEFLLNSFSILKVDRPDLNLILAGDGPMREHLCHIVKKLNIVDSVFFLGIVSNPYPLIKDALFLVLPSFSEALPTIILECFSLGKTVVATPTKGALDLSGNGKYGFISKDFNNEHEFSNLMSKALNSLSNIDGIKDYAYTFNISFKINEIKKIFSEV